jgi:pilus assembly protein FimV
VDFDLDLDFSLGDDASPTADAVALAAQASGMNITPSLSKMPQPAPAAPPVLDMNFGATVAMASTSKFSADTVKLSAPDLNLSSSSLSFSPGPVAAPSGLPALPIVIPSAAPPALVDSGMIEFDLGSLSLDLDSSPSSAVAPGTPANALDTKLALAAEFQSIGDSDGARALAQEVLAGASGPLKAKAQKFLAELA